MTNVYYCLLSSTLPLYLTRQPIPRRGIRSRFARQRLHKLQQDNYLPWSTAHVDLTQLVPLDTILSQFYTPPILKTYFRETHITN
jgi:hypothetical protein